MLPSKPLEISEDEYFRGYVIKLPLSAGPKLDALAGERGMTAWDLAAAIVYAAIENVNMDGDPDNNEVGLGKRLFDEER